MNVIGSIGQFFINYQVEIEGIVFVILILLAVYLLARYIGRDKRNEAKIAELSAKLESIENRVRTQGVGELAEGVGLSGGQSETPETAEITVDMEDVRAVAAEDVPFDGVSFSEIETASIDIPDDVNPLLGPKFNSRDWAQDKHGKVYTEEMLREQIS